MNIHVGSFVPWLFDRLDSTADEYEAAIRTASLSGPLKIAKVRMLNVNIYDAELRLHLYCYLKPIVSSKSPNYLVRNQQHVHQLEYRNGHAAEFR